MTLRTGDDVTLTSSEPTAEQYRIFHSYPSRDDVYARAARRLADGDTLVYDARDVLNLHD